MSVGLFFTMIVAYVTRPRVIVGRFDGEPGAMAGRRVALVLVGAMLLMIS